MDTLEVVAVTPTGGMGISISQIPTNVQSSSSDALKRYRPLDVTGGLGTRLGSVHLSNLGSNPFQPDMNYRGGAGRRCWDCRRESRCFWMAHASTKRSATSSTRT